MDIEFNCRPFKELLFSTFLGEFQWSGTEKRKNCGYLVWCLGDYSCSYAGGSNFWGHGNDDGIFTVQSFDDKVLEVMAVFGVIHCATSRVISLQNHRIAQVRV